MQIKSEQLQAQLARELRPLYTVHGDETLLAQEAGDAIRAAARASGCSERKVFTVSGAHFDWSAVLGAAQAMSLFAERQLIEIRMPSGKPGKDGGEALQRYCQDLSPDVVTLVQLPRLDFQQTKAGWFSALDAAGVMVRVETIERTNCASAREMRFVVTLERESWARGLCGRRGRVAGARCETAAAPAGSRG